MRRARIKEMHTRYLSLLSKKDRKKLGIIMFLQVSLSILDLVGIALIGIVGALTVSGIQSSEPVGRIAEFIEFVQLGDRTFQSQVAILGLVAASVLLTRTFISIYFTRKTLFFFSFRGALLSSQLISSLLSQNLLRIQEKTSQELIDLARIY